MIFIVALLCLACGKNKVDVIWEWEHPENDSYVEFMDDLEAFVETNDAGILGGVLTLQLGKEQSFVEGVANNVVFQNLPRGLTPEITLNNSMTRMQISLIGKVEKHSGSDSLNGILLRIAAENILGYNSDVEIQNIRMLFHDVPCTWKSPITSKKYLLVFNDEFNGAEIDKKRWRYRASTNKITRTIQYNNEDYDIFVENEASVLEDGNMVLKVYSKDKEPYKFYTGGILTLNRFMPRYGYYETLVSFNDCTGFGYWPAFWLHFKSDDKNSIGTEIDIFEYINKSKTIFQTLHWYIDDEHLSSSENFILNEQDEYHKFGLEWTPDELIFYVDDRVTRHLKNSENERFVPDAYQMVYYSMSAGTWGGNVADPTNNLPAKSKFDYCRVYQSKGQDAFYKFGDGERLIEAESRLGKS